MALWIRENPSSLCNSTELLVAEHLNRLSDDWVVRWGFYYVDDAGTRREGDFLVLGPDGGLLVLEVKSGVARHCVTSGRWETRTGMSPVQQLDAEWKAVVDTVNTAARGRPPLRVQKALGVPRTVVAPSISEFHGVPRNLILSELELSNFEASWRKLFAGQAGGMHAKTRENFFDTYAKDCKPEAVQYFIDETDRVLMHHTEASFEVLDQISENRQFLIRGGTGTGKTWLALEQAFRWAESGDTGSSVLFLCYNLALAGFLKELVARGCQHGRPRHGSVTVLSWEDLAKDLVAKARLPYTVPKETKARQDFYDRVLPGQLAQIVLAATVRPAYDALVVDEGQDLDTRTQAFPEGWQGPGWWGVLWRLLRDGARARIAVFYDPAQRPSFRDTTAFDDQAVCTGLEGRPARFRLTKTVRYTRPVFEFLKALQGEAITQLVESLSSVGVEVEGPEVEMHSAPVEKTMSVVGGIVQRWLGQGFCRPEDILIVSRHGDLKKSALARANGQVAGHALVEFGQRRAGAVLRSSAYKAKGLDALAVIVVDYPPFGTLTDKDLQLGFFIAASRARQLLAIVQAVEH